MTSGTWSTRIAILAALAVTLLSTGLPGALHRITAHGFEVPSETAHAHACEHTGHAHHDHGDPESPSDRDHHEDHDCELCLMLATGGQWGIELAESAIGTLEYESNIESAPTALIDSLPMPARLARGPPPPVCAG